MFALEKLRLFWSFYQNGVVFLSNSTVHVRHIECVTVLSILKKKSRPKNPPQNANYSAAPAKFTLLLGH